MLFSIALVMSLLSFVSLDPMKGALFLVGSLMFLLPVISYSLHVWYSYYICLLFLSGVFVVIVYFSSLSVFVFYDYGYIVVFGSVVIAIFLMWKGDAQMLMYFGSSSLGLVVVDWYLFIYVWVVLVLFIFLSFMSYFLTFEGALRKV
uniref:NADH dehydrogenase subunit 6 n=1 Tax=Clavinema parasiluri TaxID=332280 RepID=A0A9F2HGX8_9BILA|nr:NADH dehydrogenase subunit 6 [Clavinema parasiluri]WAX01695.1 NADH dehydrogenase subunit 6 [Clavinema parasiluri]